MHIIWQQFQRYAVIKRLFMPLLLLIFALAANPAAAEESTQAADHAAENPFIPLMFALGVIFLASRIGGAIARRLKQPRVLGQLIIGVILGPSVLDMLHWGILGGIDLAGTVKELAELGVLLLMFNIGLEVHLSELAKVGKVAIFAGFLGVLVPVAMTGFVILPEFGWQPALFAGVTLAATSVSISAQVLLELGHLQSKEGNALLATALIDDVLAILLVSLTMAITTSESGSVQPMALFTIILQMSSYIVIAFLIAWYLVPPFMRWLINVPEAAQNYGIPIFALILALFFGWTAEHFGGVAAITGAFIAGVGLSKIGNRKAKVQIEESLGAVAYVFLVPIFFVDVGLETDLSNFPISAFPFMLLILVMAILSKVIGAGLGAKLGGFTNQESLRVGVCMISRGEVGLIIASLGLSSGIFSTQYDPDGALFNSLFMVILLTTLLTPPLVRLVFQSNTSNTQKTADEAAASSHA